MKKHGSTTQFLTVRERPTISTTVQPSSDSARFAKKRKLTEKFELSSTLTMSMIAKQPLGASNAVANAVSPQVSSMLKNKSSEIHPKRAKQNFANGNKKTSLGNICLQRKQSMRIEPEHSKTMRSAKLPAKKQLQNRGFVSSRIVDQEMSSLERYSELHPRQLHTILQTNRPDYPSFSNTVRMSCREFRQTAEDRQASMKSIVFNMVDDMFNSTEFKFSQIARENQQLKEELLKIKECYQVLEKQRQDSLNLVQSRLILKEGQLSGYQAATQNQIAHLQFKLAEAQQSLSSQASHRLDQMQTQIWTLEKQLANERSKCQVCQRQSETFKRQLAATKKQNAALRKENNQHKGMIAENQSRLNEYSETITQLQACADQSQRMVVSLQAQLEESQSQLKASPSEMMDNLKDLVAQANSEIFRLNRQISSLELKLAIIERKHLEEISQSKSVHQKQIKVWRQRNKKLLKCNATLKRLIDQQRQDVSIDFSLNDQRDGLN